MAAPLHIERHRRARRGRETLTSPLSGVVVHHFHGAAARVPVESTAFRIRQNHLMVEVVGWWTPGVSTPHQAWVESVDDALSTDALPGGYPNMLGPSDHAQIADPYRPTPDGSSRPRTVMTRTASSLQPRCRLRGSETPHQ
jgi:hypothetical protein